MGIKKSLADLATSQKTKVQLMKYRVANRKGRITKLEGHVQKLQALVRDDMLSLLDAAAGYKSNAYPSYASAVAEINNKYNGTADWGVLLTGSIIDLRSAFIIGDGITISAKSAKEGEADKEVEWAEKFLEYNDLDEEVAQEFAKEAEIEGKIALKLALEEDKDADAGDKKEFKVSVRFISWQDKKYKIKTNPKDYLDYQKLVWQETGTRKSETLDANEFVYKKFGGRIMNPNEAAPKVMKCLTQIESLDKAERDWRQINHIFAGPILYAECENEREVKVALAAIDNKNFKLKKVLAGTFKFSFLGLDIKGIDSLEREIVTLIKMISATTGVPVHFLGFVDLMSNRSTAENLMEMINAATNKERKTWIGAYEEVIRKAMTMWNETEKKGMSNEAKLDPDKIKVDIPVITKEHYDRIEKIFLPAVIAGKISDKTFLTMIPGLDVEAELKEKEEKEKSEIEQLKQDAKDRTDRDFENNLNRGGQPE